MVEPRRADPLGHADHVVDRDSRVETLLVDGLDQYFAGQYHAAIHIWTRVLFLDRSHARARAYIDRARSAVAERQRQSEEMLHASQASLDRGDTDAARHLLGQAVAHAADEERSAALRSRLERLERARALPPPAESDLPRAPEQDPAPAVHRSRGRRWALVAGLALALLLAAAVLTGSVLPQWLSFRAPVPASVDVAPSPLRVPTAADVAMIRARTLSAEGHLAEALRALDRVDAGSPQAARADQMRTEIERVLLASVPAKPGAPIGALR